MFICPQCEFENPEANKYCQSCGISLTDKICCQCQASIPIMANTCSFCGADNHTILWAIISPRQINEDSSTAQETNESSQTIDRKYKIEIKDLSDLCVEKKNQTVPTLKTPSQNEDSSNRYVIQQLLNLEPDRQFNHLTLENNFIQAKVIDRYPLQKSHLATLQKQQIDILTELSQDLNNSYLSIAQYWSLVGLPTHALPYLILNKYTPTIPKIYDAWQQRDLEVVLLRDRSQWQLLTDLWSQQELSLLQIIWFLDEMAKLWKPLHQINCARSLLVNNNLRIDEDYAFCFQQLYMDRLDAPPTLKDLAKTWKLCFAESDLDKLDNLNQLLDLVISEEIMEIEQLRLELHNIDLDEDEIEFFDIHSNYSDVNIPQSKSDNFKSNQSRETTDEPQGFFDESDMVYSSEFEEQATAMIPMQLKSITEASCTNIGSQRDHNEDFFGIKTTIEKAENNTENSLKIRGLYIVCDGMGGHAAGEVASAMAVENLQQYFQERWHYDLPSHDEIEKGVLLANQALYKTNIDNSRSGSGRMGTTLVMALLQDTKLTIAHVGDSRIYRITKKQGLEQLTLDHEVGQREINRGVEPDIAYGRPDAYQLTQALGPRENNYVRPDIQFMEVTEDCLLLLCSDGLCDRNLLEENWQEYLQPLISSSSNLEEGLFKLIDFANEYNGHDNITAVLIRIKLKPDF